MTDKYGKLADHLRHHVDVATDLDHAALNAAALVIEDYSRVIGILAILEGQLDNLERGR